MWRSCLHKFLFRDFSARLCGSLRDNKKNYVVRYLSQFERGKRVFQYFLSFSFYSEPVSKIDERIEVYITMFFLFQLLKKVGHIYAWCGFSNQFSTYLCLLWFFIQFYSFFIQQSLFDLLTKRFWRNFFNTIWEILLSYAQIQKDSSPVIFLG